MKLDIVVNKYVLIWNLLYQSSPSEEIDTFKQQLWRDYKKEYSILHRDRFAILKDVDNFIPNDDFIYNTFESSSLYKNIKQDTNRYRLLLMEIWDKNYRNYMKEVRNILKTSLKKDYKVCVIHPSLDVLDIDFDDNVIVIGKKLSLRDKDNFLTYLFYKILKQEFANFNKADEEILLAILELAITNELYTRVTGESKYYLGKGVIRDVKTKIYPYWLMYLGIPTSKFEEYMVRDNIFFDVDNYNYENYLKEFDIFSFIKFILKNKRVILRKKIVAVENIEVL